MRQSESQRATPSGTICIYRYSVIHFLCIQQCIYMHNAPHGSVDCNGRRQMVHFVYIIYNVVYHIYIYTIYIYTIYVYTMHHKGAWIARGDAKCNTLCIYNIQWGTFVYIYTLYTYTIYMYTYTIYMYTSTIYMYTMHHTGEYSQQSTPNATLSQKSTLHSYCTVH